MAETHVEGQMATDDQDLQLERRTWRMILTKCYWMRTICKTAAWLLTLAIAILSLVPPSYRAVTSDLLT